MGLGEATRLGIYTKDAVHRPSSHMTLMGKVMRVNEHLTDWVTRYPVIRLAKLVLWALQDNRVASAWRPCDNHVCGTVAISAGGKKTRKKNKNIGHNHNTL
jgi:hypothetical protein